MITQGRPSSSLGPIPEDGISRADIDRVCKAIGGLAQVVEHQSKGNSTSDGHGVVLMDMG